MTKDQRRDLNAWIDWNEYEKRVLAIEAQGVCRSDAQGIVDVEMEREFNAKGK